MALKSHIFDNEKVTGLVERYNSNGRDPMVLHEILAETKTLLSVVTSKYSQGNVPQEDLVQEACTQLIVAIPKYKRERGKVYSFFSIVIRNAAVDFIRKNMPDVDLDEALEDFTDGITDADYVDMMVAELVHWFVKRFSKSCEAHLAEEVLSMVIADILDEDVGKKRAIDRLIEEFEFGYRIAKVIYEVVLIKLRMISDSPYFSIENLPEDSKLPELLQLLGPELFKMVLTIYYQLNLRFRGI